MGELRTAGGRRIFYDAAGKGPALLLVAGRGAARRFWEQQVPAFAPRFRVITFDNRDAGPNDPERAGYTMADLADDAAALLDGLGVARAHVIGISMGGMIALQLALGHPAAVDRLVLVATTAGGWSARQQEFFRLPPEPWIADPVERSRAATPEMVGPSFFAGPEGEARLREIAERARGSRLTKDGYVRQNIAIGTHDVRDRLAAIAAPTLVIHGDVDPLVPAREGRALAAGIPGARLIMMPEVGHLPPVERPDEFNRAVLDFLAAAPAAAADG